MEYTSANANNFVTYLAREKDNGNDNSALVANVARAEAVGLLVRLEEVPTEASNDVCMVALLDWTVPVGVMAVVAGVEESVPPVGDVVMVGTVTGMDIEPDD
jgi:hypothetical protein